jgi:WD repeat-containing protein 70
METKCKSAAIIHGTNVYSAFNLIVFSAFPRSLQFIRGDQYVLDMARTSGHVHKVTGVDWNPLERDLVLTSSLDGSVRVWNLNGKTQFQKLVCDKVYRIKNARGQRTTVTAVTYHPSGREFAVGTSCGSIQIWNSTKVGPRPDREKFDAHSGGKPITALVFNVDGTKIASRSSSDVTVHVWDTRKLSKSSAPISSCNDVPTIHDKSSCHFSPDGKCLVIGCSGFETLQNGKQQEVGVVRFFLIHDETGKPIYDFPSKPGLGVVHVKWHAKLNQIILGFSDARYVCLPSMLSCRFALKSSNCATSYVSLMVLYDETMSKNGALISMSKAGRKVDSLSELLASRGRNNILVGEIVTPLTDTPLSAKRKNTQDPPANSSKQRRPELPATGIKVGGHTSASATFTQFIARTILNTDGKGMVGQDPREDLFKYHDENDKYSKNRILADKTIEEEEEESRTKKNFK